MGAKVSPIGRVSYPRVFSPEEYQGKKSYSITLLFDKDDPGLAELKAVAAAKTKEKFGDEMPEGFRNPFKDGDKKNRDGSSPEYAGKTYVQFKAMESRKPGVVGPDNRPLSADNSSGLYPGCYARVAYDCYAYDTSGNRGVAFGLQHVQKAKDGDRLDGGVALENAFEALEKSSEITAADIF